MPPIPAIRKSEKVRSHEVFLFITYDRSGFLSDSFRARAPDEVSWSAQQIDADADDGARADYSGLHLRSYYEYATTISMKAYSTDLRRKIVSAYEQGEGTLDEVAALFDIGRWSVARYLRLHR